MKIRGVLILTVAVVLKGQGIDHSISTRGQLSGFTALSTSTDSKTFPSSLRYIPEFNIYFYNSPSIRYGLNAGFQVYSNLEGLKSERGNLDPYRLIFRLDRSIDQLRVGLQKINFGPGQFLRLLQWFDEQDIRDPLALSPGVWATMYRRFMNNGMDIRLWAIYDHEDPSRTYYTNLKQLSFVNNKELAKKPLDLGSRWEIPGRSGTYGLTVHSLDPLNLDQGLTELRLAFDGRWDPGAGIWFESTVARTEMPGFSDLIKAGLMVGADYTIDTGNGLYTSFEILTLSTGPANNMKKSMTAGFIGLNYPVSLNDGLDTYFIVIDRPGSKREIAASVGWRHTVNNWMIYLSLYDYPEAITQENVIPAGTGIQVFIVFNH